MDDIRKTRKLFSFSKCFVRGSVVERSGGAVQEELKEEVLRMAKQVNLAGFNLLCIDTENQFVTTGFGKEIAQVPQPTTLISAPQHMH